MERRSTNDIGYVHFQGDIVSNVGSSHGIRLTGGSTGGVVEPFGDDTSISIRLQGRNAGLVNIGNSTGGTVTLDSTGNRVGNASTSSIERIQRYFVQYTIPALSSGPAASESTVTVTGLTTNSILILQNRLINNSTGQVSLQARCSTANELTIQFINHTDSTLSGSTQSAYLLQFRF